MKISDRKKTLRQICGAIRKNKTFFLSGHVKPDGDTIGSELAMASLLRRLGKSADMVNRDPVPPNLMFLPGVSRVKNVEKVFKKYDVAMIFECDNAERMGNLIDFKKDARLVINIDHHLKYSLYGDINLVNPKASSNSEQLYYIFEELKVPLTADEATCLYAGIVSDTGKFQYSNTNEETLRVASRLIRAGVRPHFVSENLYGSRGLSFLKLLGHSLSRIETAAEGLIVHSSITQKDFKRTRSSEGETEEIVNYGLQVPEALISMLFREVDGNGTVKVSLRSRNNVNVCRLAEQFGGGGHKYAAGCKLDGKIQVVSKKVVAAAEELLKSTVLKPLS